MARAGQQAEDGIKRKPVSDKKWRDQKGRFTAGHAYAVGRPSTYSDEIGEAIAWGVASGQSLRKASQAVGIDYRTAWLWTAQAEHPFSRLYQVALQCGRHTLQEEILDLAEEAPTKPDAMAKVKLRIDVRKWMLDRVMAHDLARANRERGRGGGQGDNLRTVGDERVEDVVSDAEVARRVAYLLLRGASKADDGKAATGGENTGKTEG